MSGPEIAGERFFGGGIRQARYKATLPFALIAAAWIAFSPNLFNDGDTSWHLGAGKLMLANRTIPDADPFSFTFHGSAWVAHEWLAEIVMAAALQAGSWGAVALLFSAAVGLLLLLVGSELGRWLKPTHALAGLLLVAIIISPFILARPHVLSWPLLAGWTIILLRARAAHRAPPLAAAALMTLWANLHGSFLVGLLLAGAFALEALLEESNRRQVLEQWLPFGLAAFVASLLTPHGIEALLFPLQVSAMESLPLIMEWRSTDPAQDWLFLAILAGTGFLLVLRRPRIPAVRLVLLAALTYLAIAHVRHQPLIAIVAALVLAKPLSSGSRPNMGMGARGLGPVLAAFAVGMAALALVRLSMPLPRTDSPANPIAAIAALPPELHDSPGLNGYGFGGPLILAGYRPFIDGRADMYGDAFLFEHQRIVSGDAAAFRRAVARWGIAWTILEPEAPLVAKLDRSPGWRRAYADRWAVVHVRSSTSARGQ